jgi:hypothetical protein
MYSGIATLCYVLAGISLFVGVITGQYAFGGAMIVLLAISKACGNKAKEGES